jgi:1-acyl-sn-glycerol-3-phosphate acyltransferase
MLQAKKNRWFERAFAVYNRNLLRRRFHSFRVSGLDYLKTKKPAVVYANHSSWWDGLVAFEISRILKADAFVMMEERHLRKLFLFRRLGAFSVVRENPRQAVESLNYAVSLLSEKSNRMLWIFPQGEILPSDVRPLHFYQGLARIIERTRNCSAIPLAIRYEFLGEFKPEIFVKIGAPENRSAENFSGAKAATESYKRLLTETLDELKREITQAKTDDYEKIF